VGAGTYVQNDDGKIFACVVHFLVTLTLEKKKSKPGTLFPSAPVHAFPLQIGSTMKGVHPAEQNSAVDRDLQKRQGGGYLANAVVGYDSR
jgi:hypothetical protein